MKKLFVLSLMVGSLLSSPAIKAADNEEQTNNPYQQYLQHRTNSLNSGPNDCISYAKHKC